MGLKVEITDSEICKTIETSDGKNESAAGLTYAELLEAHGVEKKNSKTIVIGGGVIALCVAFIIGMYIETTWLSWTLSIGFFLISILFLISSTRILDVEYSFGSDNSANNYNKLLAGFKTLVSSNKKWQIVSSQDVEDTKYSGGAGASIERVGLSCNNTMPNCINCETPTATLSLKDGNVSFLPDRIILSNGNDIKDYDYTDLVLSLSATNFNETGGVPRDANVVGKTWRVVNKKGGPDKRIKDNPEIPICQYDMLHIHIDDNQYDIMISKPKAAEAFGQALLDYKNSINLRDAIGDYKSSGEAEPTNQQLFDSDTLKHIAVAGYMMVAIDGEVEESEVQAVWKFVIKHHKDGENLDLQSYNKLILKEYTSLLETYKDIVKRIMSLKENLSLNSQQKQEVVSFLQEIIMADGVTTDEEQALLNAFVKVL